MGWHGSNQSRGNNEFLKSLCKFNVPLSSYKKSSNLVMNKNQIGRNYTALDKSSFSLEPKSNVQPSSSSFMGASPPPWDFTIPIQMPSLRSSSFA